MNKKKISVPAITLYVLAVVFLMIGTFTIWFTYDYVNSQVVQGFVISENLKTVFNLYFSQCTSYFAYAILLYTGGVIISRLDHAKDDTNCTCTSTVEEKTVCETVEPKADETSTAEAEIVEAEVVEETK